MERHEYLVIYQLGSNEQSITELPMNIYLDKNADADMKYSAIKGEIGMNEGNMDTSEIRILGVYML